jgi:hypothetical protein
MGRQRKKKKKETNPAGIAMNPIRLGASVLDARPVAMRRAGKGNENHGAVNQSWGGRVDVSRRAVLPRHGRPRLLHVVGKPLRV